MFDIIIVFLKEFIDKAKLPSMQRVKLHCHNDKGTAYRSCLIWVHSNFASMIKSRLKWLISIASVGLTQATTKDEENCLIGL